MKRKLLFTLGCLVGLATLSYGIYAWYNAITYVSTDDAYVEGTISPVSAKVAGHVVELLVQDNQVVKVSDMLSRSRTKLTLAEKVKKLGVSKEELLALLEQDDEE